MNYETAHNYFVKNTVKPEDPVNGKIDSREKFEAVFGAAATMGKEGRPTPIDFDKQYVIVVIGNETDTATELKPLDLKKDSKNNDITFTYQRTKGEKQSFTIRPSLIIIVDKVNEGRSSFGRSEPIKILLLDCSHVPG